MTSRQMGQRLRHIPKFIDDISVLAGKSHAEETKKTIQDGLRSSNLVTPVLKESTILYKIRKGYSRPKTPLIGKGDSDEHSFINALKVTKIKGGYKLAPEGFHWSGIPQKFLWIILEAGAIVSNGFGKGIRIVIPPRFPFRRGVQRYLNSRQKKETNENMKKALKLLLTNSKTKLKDIQKLFETRK